MSARLTVVLDDEELFRRLKVKAAEDGVPMKDLIERAIRLVVGQPIRSEGASKPFDWDAYEAMLKRIDEADQSAGIEESKLPDDLSDIKKHLYGGENARQLRVAESRADYSAK